MGTVLPRERVLFVDDRKDRYERIVRELPDALIVWASTPAVALWLLAQSISKHPDGSRPNLFDEIRLDYHLLAGEVNGNSVAHALACLAGFYEDTPVICHSSSRDKACKMLYILLKKGFTDVRVESFDLKYPTYYPKSKKDKKHNKHGQGDWWAYREGQDADGRRYAATGAGIVVATARDDKSNVTTLGSGRPPWWKTYRDGD